MKKIVFILSLVFVAGLTVSIYANQTKVDNTTKTTIVKDSDDKKPCPADCTKACCTAEAKADCKATKSECTAKKAETKCCSSTKKAECSKSKSSDSNSSAAKKTAEKK